MFRPWRPFGGLFWLILLAVIFTGGKWWPALLVLVGLSIVFGSLFRENPPAEEQRPTPPPFIPTTPPAQPGPVPAPAPAAASHPSELLPATCPRCGGPIRAYEVRWTGQRSAACPYCGSNLPMKQS